MARAYQPKENGMPGRSWSADAHANHPIMVDGPFSRGLSEACNTKSCDASPVNSFPLFNKNDDDDDDDDNNNNKEQDKQEGQRSSLIVASLFSSFFLSFFLFLPLSFFLSSSSSSFFLSFFLSSSSSFFFSFFLNYLTGHWPSAVESQAGAGANGAGEHAVGCGSRAAPTSVPCSQARRRKSNSRSILSPAFHARNTTRYCPGLTGAIAEPFTET